MLLMPERAWRPPAGADQPAPLWPPARQRAIHPSERACCCRAAATFRVLLPPIGAASGGGELLFCDRHLRAGRAALAGVSAVAYDVRGQRWPLGLVLD
jgi:hypothetical protein